MIQNFKKFHEIFFWKNFLVRNLKGRKGGDELKMLHTTHPFTPNSMHSVSRKLPDLEPAVKRQNAVHLEKRHLD